MLPTARRAASMIGFALIILLAASWGHPTVGGETQSSVCGQALQRSVESPIYASLGPPISASESAEVAPNASVLPSTEEIGFGVVYYTSLNCDKGSIVRISPLSAVQVGGIAYAKDGGIAGILLNVLSP